MPVRIAPARKPATQQPDRQFGLTALLAEAEQTNQAHRFARDTEHLPATIKEGVAHYRHLLIRHHAAVLGCNAAEVRHLQKEAQLLAVKLNGGDRGYLAEEHSPGCVLQRRTAAQPGKVPLWGQSGCFVVEIDGMRARIEMRGIYGVCGPASFTTHAIELDRPFLSETGYRSFLGYGPGSTPGLTVDAFVRHVIERHVSSELRGRLLPIAPQFRA